MKVADVMNRSVELADPNQTICDIATAMAQKDLGYFPVGDNGRLVGAITDRDIVTRCVAAGKDGTSRVRDVMTKDVKYCFDDEELEHVVANMGENKVRRLPVVDRDKRLVGVVALADVAQSFSIADAGAALSKVTSPGGPHAGDKKGR
ncbi:MAG: CBS domain-containing protein [Alphaproteobacteria bacterium]